jgi:hypothetical protein
MWWLLALVVRKGSNLDPLLCGLSPLASRGRLKTRMYTFWSCNVPIRVTHQARSTHIPRTKVVQLMPES